MLCSDSRGAESASRRSGRTDEIVIHSLRDQVPDVIVDFGDLSLRGHDIREMAFSEDDQYLAVATDEGWIHVWARRNGGYAPHNSHRQPPRSIHGLEFTRDAQAAVLLVASPPNISAWRIDERTSNRMWTVPGSTPMALVDTGGTPGKFLLANGDAGMRVIDVQSGVVVADGVAPKLIAANSDGSVVVTSEDDDTAVWDIRPVLERHAVSVDARGRQLGRWGAIKRTALLPNYPNPFNPETWIPFTLSNASEVTLRVYDMDGRVVRTLDLGARESGSYASREGAAYWDGRNELGEKVASGVYFYELSADAYREIRRMVILK